MPTITQSPVAGTTTNPIFGVSEALSGYAGAAAITATPAIFINGVDAYTYLGAVNADPAGVKLAFPLWNGTYEFTIVQNLIQGGVSFYRGDVWSTTGSYTGRLPLSSAPWRVRGGLFMPPDAQLDRMDPIWREHEDSAAIGQIVAKIGELALDKTYAQIQARNGSYIEWTESYDRTRCAIMVFDGAIGAQTNYADAQSAVDLSTGNVYKYAIDFVLNAGVPVFIGAAQPGRVPSAGLSVTDQSLNTPPPATTTSFATASTFTIAPGGSGLVFCNADAVSVTSVDWCIQPQGALNPTGTAPTPAIVTGTLTAIAPDGQSARVFDATINPTGFSGRLVFPKPVSLRRGQSLRFQSAGATANYVVKTWVNKKFILIAPDASIKSNRLTRLWARAAGIKDVTEDLPGRLLVAAKIKAQTEKSMDSFCSLVAALLTVPIAPFNGTVSSIAQPSTFCPGQIDVFGAIQEFSDPLTFPVNVGDEVKFLQQLVAPADGVTIDDAVTDPNFLVFSRLGVAPATDPTAGVYVKSKIVGQVAVPNDGSDPDPTSAPLFKAANMLQNTSFRINLGGYASRKLISKPGIADKLFRLIDSVKPSGTDYWVRLSDGTALVRGAPTLAEADVSSKLGLTADYGHLIYQDVNFATSQCRATYLGFYSGLPAIGDVYQVAFLSPAATFTETVTAADAAANTLFPADATFARLAADINASPVLNTTLVATYVTGSGVGPAKVKLSPVAGSADALAAAGTTVVATATPATGSTAVLTPRTAVPALPGDQSRFFTTLLSAQQTMNGFLELPSLTTNLNDYGLGPFDSTTATVPLTVTTAALTAAQVLNKKVSRLTVEGLAYLTIPYGTTSVFLGYSAAGTFTAGSIITLTFNDGTTTYGPYTYTMLASDPDLAASMAALGGILSRDTVFSQRFNVLYPAATGTPAGGPWYLEIIPRDQQNPSYAAYTVTLTTNSTATLAAYGNAVSVTGTTVTASPNYAQRLALGCAFTFGTISKNASQPEIIPVREGAAGAYYTATAKFEPVLQQAAAISASLTAVAIGTYTGTPVTPVITLQSLRFVVNKFPEFSHDDDLVSFGDFTTYRNMPGTKAYGTAIEPSVDVPADSMLLYSDSTSSEVDITSRLTAPTEEVISQIVVDEGLSAIYANGVNTTTPATASTYSLAQYATGTGVISPITYLAGSSTLYATVGTSTIALVSGVDYAEAAPPQPSSITLLAGGAAIGATEVYGSVRATNWQRHYAGPQAFKSTISSSARATPGVRVQYDGIPVQADLTATAGVVTAGTLYPISTLHYKVGGGFFVDPPQPYVRGTTNLAAYPGAVPMALGIDYSESPLTGYILISATGGAAAGKTAIAGTLKSPAILATPAFLLDDDEIRVSDTLNAQKV